MKESKRLYSEFYDKFSLLLDEFEKECFATAKKDFPFIHDGEEESMMDSVLTTGNKAVSAFYSDWGSPLLDYGIQPFLRYWRKAPLIEEPSIILSFPQLYFRLSEAIPEGRINKEFLLVPNNKEFFNRLRIMARVLRYVEDMDEGLCNKGINLVFTDGMVQEIDNLYAMAFYDSKAIYDGVVLETAPDKRDMNALKSLLERAVKENWSHSDAK